MLKNRYKRRVGAFESNMMKALLGSELKTVVGSKLKLKLKSVFKNENLQLGHAVVKPLPQIN